MHDESDPSQPSAARRGFLQTTGSVGLLGVALALFSRAVPANAAAPAAAEGGAAQPSGYHETEHIRKYYARLRQL